MIAQMFPKELIETICWVLLGLTIFAFITAYIEHEIELHDHNQEKEDSDADKQN